MSVFNATLPETWIREPLASRYRVTKKPRTLNLADHPQIVFAPMEAVPSRGQHRINFQLRAQEQIASGTYFERGDVLLSKITPSFENGKQGMAVGLSEPFGYASTEIIPLQAEGDANNWFLFYYLLDPEVRSLLTDRMEGSTGRQRVPIHAVNTLQMSFPPVPEQEKIAAVLWKVQQAAELEEKLTATARELKTAAMRRLFSAGLNGEPTKETKIGLVPEGWDVRPIGDLCTISTGGTPSKARPDFWRGDIPWVSPKDLKRPRLTDVVDHISEEALHEGSNLAPVGSVFIVVRGMILVRDVPIALLERPMAFNQDLKALVSRGEIQPNYLLYALTAFKPQLFQQIGMSAHGTRTLVGSSIADMCLPVPPADEQWAIAAALQTIDQKVALHERRGIILRELFVSLLHRLMTGEVRVDNLDIDVAKVRA